MQAAILEFPKRFKPKPEMIALTCSPHAGAYAFHCVGRECDDRTLCELDSRGWLAMESQDKNDALNSAYFCFRCAAKMKRQEAASP